MIRKTMISITVLMVFGYGAAASQNKPSGCVREICLGTQKRIQVRPIDASSNDSRPRAWCGWWLRHQLRVADKAFNLARRWAVYGAPAYGPAVGVIVVWTHHVGQITGRSASGWIVKSGNDGHTVRERERSLRGVIAYRWPSDIAMR